MNDYGTLVIGDGISALVTVSVLADSGERVLWLPGSGARLSPPLPILGEEAVRIWSDLCRKVDAKALPDEASEASGLREFRNKAFHVPDWMEKDKGPLWGPEFRLIPGAPMEAVHAPAALESALRTALAEHPGVARREDIPLSSVSVSEDGPVQVRGSGGERIGAQRVVYADRVGELREIGGLPAEIQGPAGGFDPKAFVRDSVPMGALQVRFEHSAPIEGALGGAYLCPLPREAGEKKERHAFGYFYPDGTRHCSLWTVLLSEEECEDNHQIMKRHRRIRQALNKAFSQPEWLPEGTDEISATITGESVLFHDGLIYLKGEPPEDVPGTERFSILLDGFGPTVSLNLCNRLLFDRWQIQPAAHTGSLLPPSKDGDDAPGKQHQTI